MVLGLHREALVGGIEREALGQSPRFEPAVQFEAQVVVRARGGVLLDHEQQRPFARLDRRLGLGRDVERALGSVFLERVDLDHYSSTSRWCRIARTATSSDAGE